MITVLGKDRPGIIALVSNILYEQGCNLENVNQMILQKQFAGFFIVQSPETLDVTTLNKELLERTNKSGLTIHVDRIEDKDPVYKTESGEIFLITTIGPDQKGLVARFSNILARHQANIENLKAVFKGGANPDANIMSYQVFIPKDMDTKKLFAELRQKATELGLDIRIQHKNIFEAINKI
jgi:glycine cleavage system transcriptional repressor